MCIPECIVFMVAHNCKSCACIHHAFHKVQRFFDSGAAVNIVADENHLSFGVPPYAIQLFIAKPREQFYQLVAITVYVAYQIVQ